ncbi:MAG: universal stress protein [Phycisphaera sp. RhM]|nr:universal stress protein [Phycisphaera sp. RhM]
MDTANRAYKRHPHARNQTRLSRKLRLGAGSSAGCGGRCLAHSEGIDRWLCQDISKKIARSSHTSCLFVPHGVNGFVDGQDAHVEMRNIVVPVASQPDAAEAITQSCAIANLLDCKSVSATLVHVGDDENSLRKLRNVTIPDIDGWTWELVKEDGDPATRILETASERRADLIALTTQGHHGFLDALRGSTSDQVVQKASCPILAVPAEWHGEQRPNLHPM